MAVVMLNKTNLNQNNSSMMSSGGGHLQNQLTRSLERILEDAHLSGELKLSGRKLKDFPKAAGKYNLGDTVIADLSRNRFCELPEDVTSFAFLETLFAYHNAIRVIPETIRGLQSLQYLDLRNNQLAALPREICFLPLQVLLISNNRLVSLPEEMGRMEHLTELDAACNQITHLPARIGDLISLRSLSLRSNNLMYLPRELTCLQLVSLDVSCNKIAALPVELRLMSSLVDLELDNNPMTSPPASLCVRGLVHVFKYLETVAQKEEKSTKSYDSATLRRQITPRHTLIDNQKSNRRQNVDSGYSTSDGGLDKRWLPDENSSKFSPTPIHIRTEMQNVASGMSTPSTLSPSTNQSAIGGENVEDELKRAGLVHQQEQLKNKSGYSSQSNSTDVSPEGDQDSHDKSRMLGGIQTYREYKEALRQQRNQDSSAVYRPREQRTPTDGDSPSSNPASSKSQTSTPSPIIFSSNQSSPLSPQHTTIIAAKLNNGHTSGSGSPSIGSSPVTTPNRTLTTFDENGTTKKPVQKVIPSRNVNLNGNHGGGGVVDGKLGNGKTASDYDTYIKPNSPLKVGGILGHNNVPTGVLKNGTTQRKPVATVNGKNGGPGDAKSNRTVSWNRDVPGDKLSFTMRREIDKQKEESELIDQLRTIIETKLKMSLPPDLAPALMDGVVLCHLANHVRPRSVASIHVPSPTVPKLTMARCRKNVDNFIDACKKIGVDQELLCSCGDIVPEDENSSVMRPPNPMKMFQTIDALMFINYCQHDQQQFEQRQQQQHQLHQHHQQHGQQEFTSSDNTLNTTTINNHHHHNLINNQNNINNNLNNYNNNEDYVENHRNSLNATNTNNTRQDEQQCSNLDYDNYFKEIGIHFSKAGSIRPLNYDDDDDDDDEDDDEDVYDKRGMARPTNNRCSKPNSLDLGGRENKNKISKVKRQFNENFQLNGIIEECEYDSDMGKFNCKTFSDIDVTSSGRSSISTPLNQQPIGNVVVDDDDGKSFTDDENINNINNLDNGDGHKKIVMKRIEFFEGNVGPLNTAPNHTTTSNNEKILNSLGGVEMCPKQIVTNHDGGNLTNMSSICLLAVFVSTVIILFLFPLPN